MLARWTCLLGVLLFVPATFAADKGIVDQAAAKMAVVEVAGD